jgi:hypothetical protein
VATRKSERRATWAMRGKLRSPGHPPGWQRDQLERFWRQIARGATTEEAAIAAGVSIPVGTRWFREAGGMCPISLAPTSGRYLSLVEREEIAIERARWLGGEGDPSPPRPIAVDDLEELGHVHGRGVLSRAVAGLEEVLAERRPPCDPD